MNLIDVILELIKQFTLVGTDKQRILRKDCEDWEGSVSEDNENKIKALYWKIHQGILLRLMLPFVFFYLRKEFASIEKETDADGLDF